MSYRLYFDEVGNNDLNASKNDDNVRYLSLTGVISSRALHEKRIQPAFEQLKSDHFDNASTKPVILHRREIRDRKGAFKVLNDPEKRANFDRDLLILMETLPYICITVAIDKRAHLDRYGVWHFDPYHYCMRCLVERYVRWLDGHNFVGDVVAESRFKPVDKKLKASFERIYDGGTEHVPAGLVRKRLTSREIGLEPKIANVAALQLADLIAHPSFRAMKFTREKIEQPDDFGTKVWKILQTYKYRRHPSRPDGIISGFGTKWLPR